MKKRLTFLLSFCMVCSMSACGAKPGGDSSAGASEPSSSVDASDLLHQSTKIMFTNA